MCLGVRMAAQPRLQPYNQDLDISIVPSTDRALGIATLCVNPIAFSIGEKQAGQPDRKCALEPSVSSRIRSRRIDLSQNLPARSTRRLDRMHLYVESAVAQTNAEAGRSGPLCGVVGRRARDVRSSTGVT